MQFWEYTVEDWFVYFKWVNGTECKLYFNEACFKK